MHLPEPLAEEDLAIVHALQVAPRASWQRIASVVDRDPGTVSRRWARLQEERLAWLTIWPAAGSLAPWFDAALVRLRCRAGRAREVALAAGELPWVATVDLTAGTCDVALLLVARGLHALQERIDEVAGIDGVREHRSSALAAVHADDTRWQLRVLSQRQCQQLRQSGKPLPEAPRPPAAEAVEALLAELSDDVRRPLQQVAERLGLSEATARRTLDRAVASGVLHLGCDLNAAAAGLGRMVLLDVETAHRRTDIVRIARHPAVHRCYEAVDPGAVHVAVRLRSLTDLAAIEAELSDGIAGWRVVERLTVTGSVKRNGHLLGPDGRMLRRATAFA
jgi:DNA-binding Lrp family transcriptional regulator